jgi:hypothetical protein
LIQKTSVYPEHRNPVPPGLLLYRHHKKSVSSLNRLLGSTSGRCFGLGADVCTGMLGGRIWHLDLGDGGFPFGAEAVVVVVGRFWLLVLGLVLIA